MRLVGFGISVALSVWVSAVSAASVDRYSGFVVFGDSLSDVGNLFVATGGTVPTSPPYFNGRFSNGPVWSDLLSDDFFANKSVSVNFAFGGAQAVTDSDGIPDLALQLGLFQAKVPPGLLGSNPLASLWFGANDLFNALDAGLPLDDIKAAGVAAANAVGAGGIALGLAGIKDLLIFNLPDLGRLPAYALFEPGRADEATAGTDAFNAQLALNIAALRAAGQRVITVDMNGLFDDLLDDPKLFGVMDATTPCFIPQVVLCSPAQADQLAFFDPVHPTQQIHASIADAARQQIAAVPLPATAPLLGLGLLVLGAVRRNRRAA